MSDVDPSLTAANYVPAQSVGSNSDVAAVVAQMVQAELARQKAADAPKPEPTPLERAVALVRGQYGALSHSEAIEALSAVVAHLAEKAGI